MKLIFLSIIGLLLFASCKKGYGWADNKCWKCETAYHFVKDTCNYFPYPPKSIDSSGILVKATCQLK